MNLIEFLLNNNIKIVLNPSIIINDALKLRKCIDSNAKPGRRPVLPKNPTSTDYADMAAAMEVYEQKQIIYMNADVDNTKYNQNIEKMVEDFIRKESGLDKLPLSDTIKRNIWNKAWSRGHSSGFVEVYYELCELVEMLRD